MILLPDFDLISSLNVQVEVPAPPAVLQPLPELSFVPPADTPEAAFDLIAAANPQPEATLELDSTPEAAFDMIAAANLPPDAPPELDSTPEAAFDMIAAAIPQPEATLELDSTPEAAFDMIAAANLQPDAPPELDSAPDPETEQPAAAAADPEDAATDELEEDVDSVLPEEEEIPLEEVDLHCCTCS